MKYFAIFFFSFLITVPALAAKTVQGTVPQVQPLQPAPEGVYPNYSKNIQSAPPDYGGDFASDTASSTAGQALKTSQPQGTGPAVNTVTQPQTPNRLFVWLAAILAVIIFVWVAFKRTKQDEN